MKSHTEQIMMRSTRVAMGKRCWHDPEQDAAKLNARSYQKHQATPNPETWTSMGIKASTNSEPSRC